jgi:hypothetical protein
MLVVALLVVEAPSPRELLEEDEELELRPPNPVLRVLLVHEVLVLVVLLEVVFVGKRLLVERPVLVASVEEPAELDVPLALGIPTIEEPVLRPLVELLLPLEDPRDKLALLSRLELLDELDDEDRVEEQDVVLDELRDERLKADTGAEVVDVVLVFPELLVAAA